MNATKPERITLLSLVLLWLMQGCGNPGTVTHTLLEKNLSKAGKNRAELEKVLSHFSNNPKDSLKYQAAVFLISNMENYFHFKGEWPVRFDALFFDRVGALDNDGIRRLRDSIEIEIGRPDNKNIQIHRDIEHLSSSFIINNIEEAYDSWQNAPWSSSVSFDSFCNYILPYKSSIEPTENWRILLKERYRHILVDPDIPKTMEDILCALVDEQRSWFHWTARLGYFPGVLSISQILRAKKGSCNEMANLGAYSARALGIPVAFDYAPQYGNDNDAHRWNALILSDTSFEHFEGGEARPGDMALTGELEQKFAKVFRQYAGWVASSFAARALDSGFTDIPEFLDNPRIKDVTSFYTSVSDILLPIHGHKGRPVYLCVFKRRSWVAVEGGYIKNNTVLFPQMGKGLVYLPMYYSRGSYDAASPPVLLDANGKITTINTGDGLLQTLLLQRKYPFKRRWAYNLAKNMTGARFEGSDEPEFLNPVVLHQIPSPQSRYLPKLLNDLDLKDRAAYDSCWTEVTLNPPGNFQYLRLVFEQSHSFRVGEIKFYTNESNRPLTGIPMGNVPEPWLAFDGFPGKCIKLPPDTSGMLWVGLDLGQKKVVKRISYIPDTDRNAVEQDKTYELYYWKNKWVSTGIQKGTGLPLEYQEVPAGGLYWLNCTDCVTDEERIFTYEDGKQVWW